MKRPTADLTPLTKLRGEDRRSFGRYLLPLSLSVEAHWNNRLLPLEQALAQENISAGGLTLCVAQGPTPPVGAELTICLPLTDQPFQPGRVFAHCRGRVVRQDAPNRVAVYFEEVEFLREERWNHLPAPFCPSP